METSRPARIWIRHAAISGRKALEKSGGTPASYRNSENPVSREDAESVNLNQCAKAVEQGHSPPLAIKWLKTPGVNMNPGNTEERR